MATPLIITDRLTLVAPLGLRFHDATTGAFVGDGLSVWAYPVGRPSAKRPAIANRRGVYVLHHGYGLREREQGDGTRSYWDNPVPPNKDFVIEVTDEWGRFLPFQFIASLPAEGIYKWDVLLDSPLSARTSVPLFSSSTRNVASGMAAIRADLWDASSDAPAAWAVLEAFTPGTAGKFLGRGVADESGRIAVILSYPTPLTFTPASPPGSPLGSPPVATSPPLTEQVWSLELRAFYTPDRPVVSPLEEVGPPLPDLRFTLTQPAATLWADAEQTEILSETNLRFGRELILKSTTSLVSPLSATRDSVLFITPAV